MTSNIGAHRITEKKVNFGFGDKNDEVNIDEAVMTELKEAFRPEFLNRVDDIIVFKKLNREEIGEIARKMLYELNGRLQNLNITAEFSDEAVEKLAEKGFDPIYGARPLRRTIQSEIEDELSEKILDGSIKNGDTVLCSVEDGKFSFKTK